MKCMSASINGVIAELQAWLDDFHILGVSLSNFCILACFSKYGKLLKHYFHFEMFDLFSFHQSVLLPSGR